MEELALAIAGASCKCVKCTSPLSVFPVVLYQGGSICGRCFIPNDIEPTCIRNSSYETIAQFVKFPCQYEEFGCQEKVTPSKMNSHENTCRYKQYPCPIVFCTWKGELDKIHDHWTDLHANFILTDPKFELDLVHEYEEVYLIQLEDATFVFHISVDDKKDEFCHSLYCIDDYKSTNGYIYHLEFMKQFSSKSFSLPELPVSDSDYLSFNQTDAPKVNIKDIINELQDPLFVVCSINIDHNVTKNRKLSLQKQGAENHFLTILECPVCQEYMIPPIYQCLAGHAICNICKDLVKSCPECSMENDG